jgi:hypothetical protein
MKYISCTPSLGFNSKYPQGVHEPAAHNLCPKERIRVEGEISSSQCEDYNLLDYRTM